MKHTVHLYYAVRIRMEDVEADSQEEAVTRAAAECDVKHNLAYAHFEDDESPHLGAMVDEEGDEGEYLKTRYHEGPGAKLYLAVEGAETKASPKPNVAVILEGGLVQNVITDLPVNVTVIDHDTEGADEQDLSRVDGIDSDVYLSYWHNPEVDVRFVKQFEGGLGCEEEEK